MLASEGPAELEELSHTLNGYMTKMKDIKSGRAHLETINFNKSASAMHKEVRTLRHMYEDEIRKLRSEIQETSSQVGKRKFTHSVLAKTSEDLKQRIDFRMTENSKLDEQVSQMKKCIDEKVEAISQKRLELSQHAERLEERPTSVSQLNKALRENAKLKRAIEEESELTKASEERVRQLTEQSQFNWRIAHQQQAELQRRLSATSDTILTLESKVRQIGPAEQDENVAEMLSAIEDVSKQELCKYKQETEHIFSQNIALLQSQMDTDRKSYNSVATENFRLMGCVEELNVKIRHLQGELAHIESRKLAAEKDLQVEQECVTEQMQTLNAQLDDVQDSILGKTKELSLVKCENIPLKAEAQELKTLINDEQTRLDSALPHSTAMLTEHGLTTSPDNQAVGRRQRCSSARTVTYSESNGYPTPSHNGAPGESYSRSGCASAMQGAGYTMRNRPHSSPVSRFGLINKQRQMSPGELGQGRSYFDGLFKQKSNYERVSSAGQARHVGIAESPKSTLGTLVIHEINKDGRYIMLHNNSSRMDMEIGGYSLQQNLSGVPVTQFSFPKRITFRAGSFITIFAGVCSPELHQPPTQFVRSEQERWGTGPECTTVLCNSNGKAVAWVNAPHRHSSGLQESQENHNPGLLIRPASMLPTQRKTPSCEEDGLSENGSSTSPVYLKREHNQIAGQSLLFGDKKSYPHTASPLQSSGSRPFHSASGLRMGSAPMRKFAPISSSTHA